MLNYIIKQYHCYRHQENLMEQTTSSYDLMYDSFYVTHLHTTFFPILFLYCRTWIIFDTPLRIFLSEELHFHYSCQHVIKMIHTWWNILKKQDFWIDLHHNELFIRCLLTHAILYQISFKHILRKQNYM